MGDGADILAPWLNDWLLRKSDKDNQVGRGALLIALTNNEHPVPGPGEKELQGSQNLFLLQAACEGAAYGNIPKHTEDALVARLERERDEIGLWGSECTSPIYHHFIISGLLGIAITTSNPHLKQLCEENLGSFFWYALKMGLASSPHGLIGMRGTGHDFAKTGFPDLHFVCQYFTSGRPKHHDGLSSWKKFLSDSGWAASGLPGGRCYELYKKVFEYAVDDGWKPWRLRSKLTFLRTGISDHYGHYYEKGINGNTGTLIAYVSYQSSPGVYLPVNSSVRIRQRHDNAAVQMVTEREPAMSFRDVSSLNYSGLYTSLADSPSRQFAIVEHLRLVKLESSLDGVTGWVDITPPKPEVPATPAPPVAVEPRPKRKRKWWEFWK